MNDATVTLVTCASQEEAERIATAIVEEKLAACVNIIPGVTSVYLWDGKLCRESERLMVIKSRRPKEEALRIRILALHSYKVPEIVTFPIASGHEAYLRWITEATS